MSITQSPSIKAAKPRQHVPTVIDLFLERVDSSLRRKKLRRWIMFTPFWALPFLWRSAGRMHEFYVYMARIQANGDLLGMLRVVTECADWAVAEISLKQSSQAMLFPAAGTGGEGGGK